MHPNAVGQRRVRQGSAVAFVAFQQQQSGVGADPEGHGCDVGPGAPGDDPQGERQKIEDSDLTEVAS